MKTTVETITPEIAKEYLKRNFNNRPLREKDISFYSNQIKSGLWRLTGQGISFDKSNKLIDGQHRLNAIIRANKAVEMLVVRDVSSDTFDVYDTGKNRSAGDVLSINGVKNSVKAASIIAAYNSIKSCVKNSKTRELKLTNHIIYEKYSENEDLIEECIKIATSCRMKFNLISVSSLGAFIMYTNLDRHHSLEAIKNFLYQLHSIYPDDFKCTLRFREFIIKNKMNYKKIPKSDLNILLFYNFNYWLKGNNSFPVNLFDLDLKKIIL